MAAPGLVEAGTYLAILGGTILAGVLAPTRRSRRRCTVGLAILGYLAGRQVPPAPPAAERIPFDRHIIHARSSLSARRCTSARLFLAILAISFFWTIGAVLIIIFPPLVKNVLGAERAGREPVHRNLLGRDRDRLGARSTAC